jgi:hypothetical protein
VPGPPENAFKFFPQVYFKLLYKLIENRNLINILKKIILQTWISINEARNIPCDTYLSCQYDPIYKANFSAIHYFSSIIYFLKLFKTSKIFFQIRLNVIK